MYIFVNLFLVNVAFSFLFCFKTDFFRIFAIFKLLIINLYVGADNAQLMAQ